MNSSFSVAHVVRLFSAMCLLSPAAALFAQGYSFKAFGLGIYEPESDYSAYNAGVARAVNDGGAVVGNISGAYDLKAVAFVNHVAVGSIGQLGSPERGGHFSDALSINHAGDVVGWSEDPASTVHAFYKPAGGAITDLGAFGGVNSMAYKINNTRQILIQSDDGAGQVRYHLQAGGTVLTFPSKAPAFRPADLNDKGQVIGYGGGPQLYSIANKTYTSLGRALGMDALPAAINDGGAIAGTRQGRLFYHVNGVLSTAGANVIAVHDLNNAGQVVGTYVADETRGFVYTKARGFVDLTTLLPAEARAAGWQVASAEGINESGVIVGMARRPLTENDPPYLGYEYVYRACELTPLR